LLSAAISSSLEKKKKTIANLHALQRRKQDAITPHFLCFENTTQWFFRFKTNCAVSRGKFYVSDKVTELFSVTHFFVTEKALRR
jgi:hypothetical protein